MPIKRYIYFWSKPQNLRGKHCRIIGKGTTDKRKMMVKFEDGLIIECWAMALRGPEKLRSKQLVII